MTLRVGFGVTLAARALGGQRADGIAIYGANLCRHLPEAGDIDLIPSSFPPKPWQRSSTAPSGQHARFGCAYGIGAAISAATGASFPGSRALTRRMDLFHAPDHLIPKLRGVPVVATICDALPVKRPDWINAGPGRFRSKLVKAAAGWADHVIAISAAMVPDLVQYMGIRETAITVVHLGVDAEWFDVVPYTQREEVLATYGLRKGYYLFVGTLQPRKNIETIIAAYESLPDEVRGSRQLVVAGQAGWGSDALTKKLRSMTSSGCIWLEYVPASRLRALYQNASMFVFPSLWEGFGMPVLEAFASGVPVITSNVSSLPEVAGDAALLVDPHSPTAVRDAMLRLTCDTALADALRQRGSERARQMSWAECARRTVDVYRKLI